MDVVPMFHANARGAPFGAAMLGSKQVLPGRQTLDKKSLCKIIVDEKVTYTCGGPAI